MTERETLLLGGRAFARAEDTTVEQDLFIMGRIREAGLNEITLRAGESPDEFSRRLIGDLAASGVTLPLLGGLIVPAESGAWSPSLAASTAEYIATLADPEDKLRVNTLIVSMLLGFFESGIVSLHEWKRSLDEMLADPDSTNSQTQSTANRSESGPESSISSPAETPEPAQG